MQRFLDKECAWEGGHECSKWPFCMEILGWFRHQRGTFNWCKEEREREDGRAADGLKKIRKERSGGPTLKLSTCVLILFWNPMEGCLQFGWCWSMHETKYYLLYYLIINTLLMIYVQQVVHTSNSPKITFFCSFFLHYYMVFDVGQHNILLITIYKWSQFNNGTLQNAFNLYTDFLMYVVHNFHIYFP